MKTGIPRSPKRSCRSRLGGRTPLAAVLIPALVMLYLAGRVSFAAGYARGAAASESRLPYSWRVDARFQFSPLSCVSSGRIFSAAVSGLRGPMCL